MKAGSPRARGRAGWGRGILLFSVTVAAATVASPAAAEWWEMSPPDLGFAVEIPGDTIYKEDNTHPDLLAARHDYIVVASDIEGPLYIVSVLDFRPEVRAAMSEDAVFAFATGLIENCRTTATEERPADVGMRMDIALACIGDYHVRGQLRLAGDRLWRATVGGPGDVADDGDATRFLSSFRLVAE